MLRSSIVLSLVVGLAACGSEGAHEAAPPSSAAPPPSPPPPTSAVPAAPARVIDPLALAGCRAPNEEGCAACCYFDADLGTCMRRAAEGDRYAAPQALDGPCEAACRPCAACARSDEAALAALAPRDDCTCADGDDAPAVPCEDAATCACWCAQRAALLAACPAPPG